MNISLNDEQFHSLTGLQLYSKKKIAILESPVSKASKTVGCQQKACKHREKSQKVSMQIICYPYYNHLIPVFHDTL